MAAIVTGTRQQIVKFNQSLGVGSRDCKLQCAILCLLCVMGRICDAFWCGNLLADGWRGALASIQKQDGGNRNRNQAADCQIQSDVGVGSRDCKLQCAILCVLRVTLNSQLTFDDYASGVVYACYVTSNSRHQEGSQHFCIRAPTL